MHFDGGGIDSRNLRPGSLFVALVSERDGHDFVGAASAAGAAAALVERLVDVAIPQIVVSDTQVALVALGRGARSRLEGADVIGVTGSVGKTTTKDLLASILALAGPSAASERSLNNELGVPLTLLGAPSDATRVVVEMGARGAGHIAHLCSVASPTVGVVTAVVEAHTEVFGSVDDIAVAKGELIESLPRGGLAVLNADDVRVAAMASRSAAPVLSFGDAGEVRAFEVMLDDDLRPHFRLTTPWGHHDVALTISGRHNVGNALAAAAAALGIGVPLDTVVEGLQSATGSPWRMAVDRTPSGAVVINDSYNANPTSMRAALDALAAVDARRRIAVLGVMAELGDSAAADHAEIADYAASLGIEVVAVGTDLYGPNPSADVDAAARRIGTPDAHTAVLVKGSRVAGLETLPSVWG